MKRPWGVGIIGPGIAAQAIHMAVLPTLRDRLRLVHVMGPDAWVASSVARRAGARHSVTEQALFDDPAVDIVVVCSPDRFHVSQVEAACNAGKRAVLCEKPLAVSAAEADRIALVAERTATPVVVGTMNAFDPAYLSVREQWGDLPSTAQLVRSVIHLPASRQYIDRATEVEPSRRPPAVGDDEPPTGLESVRRLTLGLFAHVFPLLRPFLGEIRRVDVARELTPMGCVVSFETATRLVQLVAYLQDHPHPLWTLEAWSPRSELRVNFPPPYVQAGSAVAKLRSGGEARVWGPYAESGYRALWSHVADVAEGSVAPRASAADLAGDVRALCGLVDRMAEAGRR